MADLAWGLRLCVLCHTPQSVDPNTGNTVDLPKLSTKSTWEQSSPNAQAGNPYQIFGFSGHTDWHDVVFPEAARLTIPATARLATSRTLERRRRRHTSRRIGRLAAAATIM